MENLLCCFPFLLLIGVGTIVGADRHHRRLRMLRRDGVRVTGWVVGHDDKQHHGETSFVPVVAYRDNFGVERHFRMNLVANRTDPPVGAEVPVLFVPGRPELVDADSEQSNRFGYRAPMIAGIVLVGLAVVIMIAAIVDFVSRIEVSP